MEVDHSRLLLSSLSSFSSCVFSSLSSFPLFLFISFSTDFLAASSSWVSSVLFLLHSAVFQSRSVLSLLEALYHSARSHLHVTQTHSHRLFCTIKSTTKEFDQGLTYIFMIPDTWKNTIHHSSALCAVKPIYYGFTSILLFYLLTIDSE